MTPLTPLVGLRLAVKQQVQASTSTFSAYTGYNGTHKGLSGWSLSYWSLCLVRITLAKHWIHTLSVHITDWNGSHINDPEWCLWCFKCQWVTASCLFNLRMEIPDKIYKAVICVVFIILESFFAMIMRWTVELLCYVSNFTGMYTCKYFISECSTFPHDFVLQSGKSWARFKFFAGAQCSDTSSVLKSVWTQS